ncbi:MAG: RodZ family helix-turn-helix domain-containing protein [Pseudomonadaceae bacterium]
MSSKRHDATADMAEQSTLSNPGETLREAREARRLSTAEVGVELKISRQAVEHIEAGQFDRLPGDTFTRGYIRSYARLMSLDPNRLAVEFDRYRGIESRERPVSSIARVNLPENRGRSVMRWTTLLIVVLLTASAAWWYESNRPAPEPLPPMDELESELLLDDVEVDAMTLPESIAEQTDGIPADLLPPEEPAESSTEDGAAETVETELAEAAPEGAEAPATEASGTAVAEPAVAEPAVATPTSGGLQLSVAADCWVQVSAADGKVLHSGLLREGQSLDIPHDGALSLVIGDRSAVTSLRFKGNPVTLPPQSQSGVVRLHLGE